jgi:xanthine dehydrogenase accessory factor
MEENKTIIWEQILSLLEKGEPVILFIVAESKGSSPGKAGFKMIVTKDGQSYGSTGGGKSEYEFINLAKSLIKGEKMSIQLIEKKHHSKEGETNESICGGSQSQIVIPLAEKHIQLIKSIIKATDNKNGIIKVDSCGLHLFDDIPAESDYLFHKENDFTWSYEEKIQLFKKVFIIGGGHVGLAISRIMKFLKFQVIVLDNRSDLKLIDQNTYADKKMIVNYDDIAYHVPESDDHYIIIATHAHKNDQHVLQKLIKNKYGYLGMLGSKAKVKQVFSNLEEQGISEELLAKVHAPIGLPIKSKTPEEIAVSIAAQIIELGL